MDLVLYGNWRSSCSQRVAIGLRLKHLPFRYQAVDLDAREQEGEAFLALHGGAQVPVLVADGVAMGQSLAILEWLEERWPGRGLPLLGTTATERQRAREIALVVTSQIQPFQLPGATRRRLQASLGLDGDPARAQELCRTFSQRHLEACLPPLEELVAAASDGPFALGEAPGLADCCLVPQLISAAALGVDVNRFSCLSRLYAASLTLEAFRASHPSRQPDAPGNHPEWTAAASRRNYPLREAAQHQTRSASQGGAIPAEVLRAKEPDVATTTYLLTEANAPIPALDWVRAETCRLFGPHATKMTPVDGCLLLRWLVTLQRARLVLEVGVFTGSSSLALASGLEPGGQLIGFDVDAQTTAIAREAWQRAGLADRVSLRLEDATLALPALAADPAMAGAVDLAYVDGSNSQYQTYWQALMALLRPGGLVVFDNTLWKGRVADPACREPQVGQLRDLLSRLRLDPRLEVCTLSLGDGITLVQLVEDSAVIKR